MLWFIEVVTVIITRNDGFQKVQLDQNVHINQIRFFTSIRSLGHYKHMNFSVGYFHWSDIFDQMSWYTSSKKKTPKKNPLKSHDLIK
jgi:hypothetical protein